MAYLRKFSYANATWDDLVNILDSVAPEAKLKDFSNVWVKQKGLPTISYSVKPQNAGTQSHSLLVSQDDPYGRSIFWPQRFRICIDYGDSTVSKEVAMDKPLVEIPLEGKPLSIFPNIDGRGYGRFTINEEDLPANINAVASLSAPKSETGLRGETAVYSTLLNLHENFLMGRLAANSYFAALSSALAKCDNALVCSTISSCMASVRHYAPDSTRHADERLSLQHALGHKLRPTRQQLLRSLSTTATDRSVVDTLYHIWAHQDDTTVVERGLLTTRDFTRMAWHLAIALPGKADYILARQRTMLRTNDERREFDYVSRACTADTAVQRKLFLGLIPKAGRTVEPWAQQMLSLLCDRSREPLCNSYITPGLDSLLHIQQTSDIFFPGYWLTSLLSGQHSAQARKAVATWTATHKDYPETLLNKVKQAAYGLMVAERLEKAY